DCRGSDLGGPSWRNGGLDTQSNGLHPVQQSDQAHRHRQRESATSRGYPVVVGRESGIHIIHIKKPRVPLHPGLFRYFSTVDYWSTSARVVWRSSPRRFLAMILPSGSSKKLAGMPRMA